MIKMTKQTLLGTALLFPIACLSYDLRIDNVNILNGSGTKFSEPSRVYIEDGKITDIELLSKPTRAAKQVKQGKGHFMLPGLIDMHVHLAASGATFDNYQHVPLQGNLNSTLYYGITGAIDLMMSPDMMQEVSKLGDTSPKIFASGPAFTNPKGHGTQFGIEAHEVTTLSDIEPRWKLHINNEPALTKAIIETYNGSMTPLSDEVLSELGRRSKNAGLPFFVHVSTLEDGKRALRAGATALAHGINFEPVDDEFIALMKQNNATYIATLGVYHNHGDEAESQSVSSLDMTPLPSQLATCLFREVDKPEGFFKFAWHQKSIAYNNVARLKAAGIAIGGGSDAGNPYTPHGLGLMSELQALKHAGLSNTDILNSVTTVAAKALGVEKHYGTVAKDQVANFILLENNPLVELNALNGARSVYLNGQPIVTQNLVADNQAMAVQGRTCHQAAQSAGKVLFQGGDQSQWQELSDSRFSGSSVTQITQQNQALSLLTTLGKPSQYGAFSGASLYFSGNINATEFEGVEVRYNASRAIYLSLYAKQVKNWDYHHVLLPVTKETRVMKVPFSQLTQFGYGNTVPWNAESLTGMSLIWRLLPGESEVSKKMTAEIESIRFY